MALPKWAVATVLVLMMLFCGACLTLNKKLQYQTSSVGIDPGMGEHAFQKPWFCTCCMFVGESIGLLVFAVKRVVAPEEKKCELSWWGIIWRSSLPAVLDLAASGFGSVGLLYITASSFQMLRGWSILFTAVMSRLWLQRVWEFRQLFGLSMVFVAMGLVGFAGVWTAGSTDQTAEDIMMNSGAWGVLLVAFGQLFQASQFVWEEKVMKKVFIPPLLLLGIEGIVGLTAMCTVVFPLLMFLPGVDVGGSQENIWDSLAMVRNSSTLIALFSVYLVCVSTLNCCGVYCTKVLSGVHRALVQTGLRTMVIWTAGILLFYHSHGTYGEPWSGFASYMELFGFILFLLGSMLYSKMIDLPFNNALSGEYKQLPAGP